MSIKPLDLTRFDLNLLVVLEALLHERHVGRAARRLHLSQSATSHALSRLREALDDPLFLRHPHGVEPTPLAASLAQPLAEVLEGVRRIAVPRAPFDPSRMGREFVIGTTDYGVMTVLSRAISAVTAKSPDSTVRAVLTDQADVVRQLDSSAIDLAVGAGGFARWPRRIEVLHLFDERFVGIARVGHPCLKPGRGGPRVGLECFLSWPHVLVSPGGDTRGAVDEVLAASGRSRRIASTSPSFISAPFVVGATDLLAVVPEKLGSTLASAAGIAIFELPLDMAPWSVGIGRLVSRAAEPEIAWLTERLQESAAQA